MNNTGTSKGQRAPEYSSALESDRVNWKSDVNCWFINWFYKKTIMFPCPDPQWHFLILLSADVGEFSKKSFGYFLTIHSSCSYFVSMDLNHSYMFINVSPPCGERELLPSPKAMVFVVKSIIWEKEMGLGHHHLLKSCSHQKSKTTHGRDREWWATGIATGGNL